MVDLNSEQTINSVKIFLNVFGLILEEKNSDVLDVYDKENNIVGNVYPKDDKVVIKANVDGNELSAYCEMSEGPNYDGIKKEQSVLDFFISSDKVRTNGQIILNAKDDEDYGIKCSGNACINTHIIGDKCYAVNIQRNCCLLDARIKSENSSESIYMSFFGEHDNGISHKYHGGKYNKKKRDWSFVEEAGVFNYPKEKKENCLSVDRIVTRINSDNMWVRDSHHEDVRKVNTKGMSEEEADDKLIIQKGQLMNKLDPSMNGVLKMLRNNVFVLGNTSILDNLISMCYDSYPDEVINALFNMERDRSFHQDGAKNLTETYFGTSTGKIRHL